jgi:MFS transporter, BCD family, chlorophyll transporter
MGLWGAAQAVAFGMGGLLGAAASDVSRQLIGTPGEAYALVFGLEGLLFIVAAGLAWRVAVPAPAPPDAASRHMPDAASARRGTLTPANDLGAAA